MSWREIILGDAIHIKHGFAFKSPYFSDAGLFMLLTPGNFHEKGGFRVRPAKERFYTGDFPSIFLLKENDLIVAMTEQGAGLLGSSAWIPESDKYLHNQRLGKIDEIDESILYPKYLYHLFNTHNVRGQISGSATGTKVRHTAPERIYKVKVRVPDINSQATIASIIDTYDDLIENNRRRIELLEESARLLYKEWFVFLRFPGHEYTKIIDGVPEGWDRKTLGEVTSCLNRGITPKYADDGEYTVINQKCIRNRLLSLDLARKQTKEYKIKKAVLEGDVLVNSTGTGTLGRVAQCWKETEKTTVDTHVTIVRPLEDIPNWWFGYAVMEFEPLFEGMGEGATNQKELKRTYMAEVPILLATNSLMVTFHRIASDNIQQIVNLSEQNKKLTQARDLLLPRLMNGEIEV